MRRLISLRANHNYSKNQNRVMRKFIRKELPKKEGASTKSFEKGIASMIVVEDLIDYLWCFDEYNFVHERGRVQLAFAILILTLLGIRPGEIVESSCWRNSNEGILYKDVTLSLMRVPGGQIIAMKVKLRNRKGDRETEGDKQMLNLTEDPTQRMICPVTHFLALALADGALEGINELSDLSRLKIPESSMSLLLGIKKHMADIPVLRAFDSNGQPSRDKILKAGSLAKQLHYLGQRAGYKDRLTPYCFRRWHGNKLDKAITAAQRRQRMGHKHDDTFQAYISRISGVDSQSIMLDQPQREELFDVLRSMAMDRQLDAPMPPGSKLTAPRRARPESFSPGQDYKILREMQRDEYLKEREDFFKRGPFERIETCQAEDAGEIEDDGVLVLPPRSASRFLSTVLKYQFSRAQVAKNFCQLAPGESLALADAVKPLMEMAKRDEKPAYYQTR
ncbi:hypothetical protein K469DRAFT_675779 [Zopfia rhizophila CBS 207.26]|uniref:Uncharacterized protein n=1 Tax=Zopfia rhizophila CBS 207.26 TaxID=1314779 RepID=A0A6A6DJU4_9PEZI|nr:hypothetical protein K469DRAFT_681192 [Zopfia rhizophila CBS 207.26]KAF2178190.1 hypothetical protein K469DRAFT_675779 [Zopfia rhizophila CBS 207.26]